MVYGTGFISSYCLNDVFAVLLGVSSYSNIFNIYIYIWGFPEMGVPPNHPFIDYKPSIVG
jgi:hypothetical protein